MLFEQKKVRGIVPFLLFRVVISLNSRNSCHFKRAENLAVSVDFRLIQNLSMLIKAEVSLLGWRLEITSRS